VTTSGGRAPAGFHPGEVIRVRTQISGGQIVGMFDGASTQTKPAGSAYQSFVIPILTPGIHRFHVRHTNLGFSGAYVMPLRIV
jgi:hypothetical protein